MLERKKIRILLISLILILGFYLRYRNYDVWPREGATFDEYAWPWLGVSLIQKGIPISWSPHPHYKNYKLKTYREARFRLVEPYLEHPPLFGIISGAFVLGIGAKDMFDSEYLNPTNLRKLSLLLGVLSIASIYLLASKIYDYKTGLFSSLLYALVPSVGVGSRLLQNENFMIPIWLLTLYILINYLESKKRMLLWIVGFLSAIIIWAKIPWFVIGLSCCAILVYKKRIKACFLIGALMLLSLGLFFAYGYYWNWDLFISLWGLQLARYDIGLDTILALFRLPYITDRFLADGWIYFGWIAISLILLNFKKHFIIISAFLTYFVTFFWAIPGIQAQGWYRYPFYPFLIISTAFIIIELLKKPSLLAIIFQFLVGSSVVKLGFEPIFGIDNLLFRTLIIFWSLPALLVVFVGKKFARLYRYSLVVNLLLFLILSSSTTILYSEQ